MVLSLEQETSADCWEIEALLDTCFSVGRTALSSYQLRADVAPQAELCLLMRDDHGAVAASIRYWPIRIGGSSVLLLGPLATHPIYQGEGLAAYLITQSLDRARAIGGERVLLVGDLPYYERFGFHRLEDVSMPPPTNPARILGFALTPSAWDGVCGCATSDQRPNVAAPSLGL